MQEIPVYGAESTTEGGGAEGEAARYPEDIRDCPVLEVEDGTTKKQARLWMALIFDCGSPIRMRSRRPSS